MILAWLGTPPASIVQTIVGEPSVSLVHRGGVRHHASCGRSPPEATIALRPETLKSSSDTVNSQILAQPSRLPASGTVGVFRQIAQVVKELLRLADEKPHCR